MHCDTVYKSVVELVMNKGKLRTNRTGVPTLGVFGHQVRYDLREGFPLLTTKRVSFHNIKTELLWFLRGDTNVKYLQEHNCRIWDEWATKEQCAKFGREPGELGPVYGKLWRSWNVPLGYIDQIADVIAQIKSNPNSRRLIVTGWNPETCDKVALPPCHTLFQFYVQDGELSCQLYQRSCDLGLGAPYNVASYALLTHMIAQVCGLGVGEFVHTFGDLHIYSNHIAALREQITREPYPMCKLQLNPTVSDINNFKLEEIMVVDYQSHPAIKMDVAV